MINVRSVLSIALFAALSLSAIARADTPDIRLAVDGKAAFPVVVSEKASLRVRAAAGRFATYLDRISGATFDLNSGDGSTGIAVGVVSDFPGVSLDQKLDASDPAGREDYVLRSHPGGIYVIGATELAVEHATWDLLHRLGYRQFFPGEHWEIVPSDRSPKIAVDTIERPSYHARRIWYGFGPWGYASAPYADWCEKNLATSGIHLSTGHAYDGILRANKKAFAEHPEYLGLVKGERKSSKFCISNPGLRKLIADYFVKRLAKSPNSDSISIDPSDGGNWCECAECAKLGSITDRAITLANEVAAAVTAEHPGIRVGLYGYNYHAAPPAIKVHPAVVVSVATAFIKGGQTLNEELAGWSEKASELGIREYYSVNTWDRDQPAAARGGNLAYLKRTIPEFHAKGARYMSAESSDNWGPNGLGYYFASRLLWDVREAGHADEIVEDFLTRAFGPAKEPMREFYKQLDGSEPHLVASNQIGQMFRSLDAARKLASSDPAVLARIDDLTQYAHYVDLYNRYTKAAGEARQAAFEALIRHAYRMRTTMLVHTKALYRDLSSRDKSVKVPPEATWKVKDAKNPWKTSEPFTPAELAGYIAAGIVRYPLTKIDFKPVAYSDDLTDASKLNLPADLPPGALGPGRGTQVFFTRVATAPAEIGLLVTGGLIEHYRDRGNVKISLWKVGGPSQTGEKETLVFEDHSVAPDGHEQTVKLKVDEAGLYRVTVSDGKDMTLVKWDCPLPMNIRSTADEPMNKTYDVWLMYFYVPKGTKVIGLYGGENGEVRDSAGHPLFWLNGRDPNYYSVEVPNGQDGKAWSIRYGHGAIRLLTVPPFFARTPAELLLPSDVVAKDAEK